MTPRNILVLAEGQLGDLLLLTPALRLIKDGLPDSRITVLILQRRGRQRQEPEEADPVHDADPQGTAAVLLGSSAVDRVVEFQRHLLKSLKGIERVRGESGVVRWVRSQKFDQILCTFPEDRFAMLAYMSGAKIRVGQRQQRLRWLLNRTPDIQKSETGVLEYYCGLARALGAEGESPRTEFAVSPEAMQWARECIALQCGEEPAPVVIHPGASGDYKIWPPERFAALVDRLHEKDVPVLLCGGEGDRDVVQKIRSRVHRALPVVITEGSLQRLAGVFAQSALVVSNDSGPRHLAIAVGAKTLAFFRQYHDREWNVYPETGDCRILRGRDTCKTCPAGLCADRVPPGEQFGSHCVRMITVDQAVTAIHTMLTSS
jgi:ADP-heptose:LPS heptosyltransferase